MNAEEVKKSPILILVHNKMMNPFVTEEDSSPDNNILFTDQHYQNN